MPTGLIYDDRFLNHLTGPGHPERPDRLRAIVQQLRATHLWDQLLRLPVQPADLAWIERLHAPAYVRRFKAACEAEGIKPTLRQARARFEREYIAAVLQHHRGRIADAARALGIQRTNLYRKMRRLNLMRPRGSTRGEG